MSNYQDENIGKYAEMFKALSNPNRLKIFLRLISCCAPGTIWNMEGKLNDKGCTCVGDLSQDLDIVSSTISHHISDVVATAELPAILNSV